MESVDTCIAPASSMETSDTDQDLTDYIAKVKALEFPPKFQQIVSIARDFIRGLQEEEQKKLWEQLDRGKALLSSHKLLCQYLYSFGSKHETKMYKVFKTIPNLQEVLKEQFSIIDWGCGQGLATMCFFDYFNRQNIQKVILIEPSGAGLNRAFFHVNEYLNAEDKIQLIKKFIDDVEETDICTETPITFHLFSNILDISKIDVEKLAKTINKNITPRNKHHYFLCVSPLYEKRELRIDDFYNALNSLHNPLDKLQLRADEENDTYQYNCTFKLKVFELEKSFESES
jgi:hypothetical protein